MEPPINNVLGYVAPPSEREFQRRRRLLWLSAAVSFAMAAAGYAIMAYYVLR